MIKEEKIPWKKSEKTNKKSKLSVEKEDDTSPENKKKKESSRKSRFGNKD